jgi:hypothetical protein
MAGTHSLTWRGFRPSVQGYTSQPRIEGYQAPYVVNLFLSRCDCRNKSLILSAFKP